MTLIQLFLVFGIILLWGLYARFFKNKIINNIVFVLLFLSGIVAVIFPELSNKVANFVGVGRGADLLTYLMVLVFYASFYFLYSKIEKVESHQTEIIRQLAIRDAQFLKKEQK